MTGNEAQVFQEENQGLAVVSGQLRCLGHNKNIVYIANSSLTPSCLSRAITDLGTFVKT